MSERIKARRDIGQAIDGNVNEALLQSNVVNFNVGSYEQPLQTLTDLQRKRIADLVRDLCVLTQEDALDVYRVILTEFDAERMWEMPRENYHAVVAQVERWIAENKQAIAATPSAARSVESWRSDHPTATSSHRCDTCNENDVNYARLQRVSRGQWWLSAALAVACGLLLYKMPAPANTSSWADQHCFFGGKPYSAGTTLKSGAATRECLMDPINQVMTWGRPNNK